MTQSERFIEGDRARRQVLGDHYVDTTLTDWSPARPLLELITEFAWGSVWSRPGLDRRTRSLITIATLAATDRHSELTLHLRGAVRNGVDTSELVETALQIAVYAGIPSGLEAVKLIRQVTAESI
ncbi:carboxymuconolactone decarboxylase family protein [Nocardia brasiliensis]|uniref:carboxymuconolactone decarboxylase family protein n=1 Tax=Nocardia brasiliensis TaxID=37326 RepID=UPI002457D24D|nr:carboxymuconolactone decarboxylase family protein [Nocardia brasiliensis]